MTKKKPKKDKEEKPRVNKELEGFDIEIDAFGEIKTNYDINKINEFLNREVDDKKLRHLKGKSTPKKKYKDKDPDDQASEDDADTQDNP
ncbi:MAG: hypothetical protein DHS20C17_27090 [Cyclobacteriaceae bacterium]|nr:MAG: hypothetical protein DHS20C17_27090 [Cyclobacteriaceae bacterium]